MEEKLYTIKEATELLGYNDERALYRRIHRFDIPTVRSDGRIRVKISDLYHKCPMCGELLSKNRKIYCSKKCYKASFKSL